MRLGSKVGQKWNIISEEDFYKSNTYEVLRIWPDVLDRIDRKEPLALVFDNDFNRDRFDLVGYYTDKDVAGVVVIKIEPKHDGKITDLKRK